jgi:hypothetical protein
MHGQSVYLRDEGRGENQKHLWWLDLGAEPAVTSLNRDLGVIGEADSTWGYVSSYAADEDGGVWACAGESFAPKALVHRSQRGQYQFGVMRNSVDLQPKPDGSGRPDQGLSVTGITAVGDGSFLLVGYNGMFRLAGKQISRLLWFNNTAQRIPVDYGQGPRIYQWKWNPTCLVPWGQDSYVVSGDYGGIYLLSKADGQWRLESIDEDLGTPVLW